MRAESLVLVLALAAGSPALAEELAAAPEATESIGEALFKRVDPSVVMISHESALGSGFILTPDGYIMTNGHVVMAPDAEDPKDVAKRITVTLYDDRKYPARVIGHGLDPDVALIKIDLDPGDEPLAPVTLGDSDAVHAGQRCFAFGAPLGLKRCLTGGIVSNVDRTDLGTFVPIIQMDAPINHGNSGGPLFNEQGQVIGINTYGFEQGQNLGFAVPINVGKVLREHYLKHGRILRAAVPTVLFQHVDDVMGKALGIPSGVLVGHVIPGSEADRAGFLAGDVIVSLDGAPVSAHELADVQRFNWRLVTREVGSSVTFGLVRPRAGAEAEAREIVFQLRQDERAPRSGNQVGEVPARIYETLGLGVQEVGAKARLTFNLPDAPGVLVSVVQPGTSAQKAGLSQGDILTRIEGVATPDPDRFAEELEKALKGRKKAIRLEIQRQKQTIQTAMAPYYALAGKKVAVLEPAAEAEWMELLRRGMLEAGAELVLLPPGEVKAAEVDALLLVGGPGSVAFQEDAAVAALVREAVKVKKTVAALGPAAVAVVKAEPSLLDKKMTTSEDQADKAMALQAKYTGKPVERDGKLITGTGFDKPAAKEFLKALVRALTPRGD